jgi:hypothetical protein
MSMTDDAPETLTTEEVAELQHQLAISQAAITALARRLLAGDQGRVFLPHEELDAVVGFSITMTEQDEGVVFTLNPPKVEIEPTTLAHLVTHVAAKGIH